MPREAGKKPEGVRQTGGPMRPMLLKGFHLVPGSRSRRAPSPPPNYRQDCADVLGGTLGWAKEAPTIEMLESALAR